MRAWQQFCSCASVEAVEIDEFAKVKGDGRVLFDLSVAVLRTFKRIARRLVYAKPPIVTEMAEKGYPSLADHIRELYRLTNAGNIQIWVT